MSDIAAYPPEGVTPIESSTEEQSRKRGRDESHDDEGERQYKKVQGRLIERRGEWEMKD